VLFAAHSASLDYMHASNLWNKLGKQRIERWHEEQLEQLVQRTLDLVSSCEARNLANLAHGVAKCGLRSRVVRPLYEAVVEAAVRGGLAGFKPQNLANTVTDGQQQLLPESQRRLCYDAMVATIARPSGLQRSVAAVFAAVWGPGFEEEHLEPCTGYSRTWHRDPGGRWAPPPAKKSRAIQLRWIISVGALHTISGGATSYISVSIRSAPGGDM